MFMFVTNLLLLLLILSLLVFIFLLSHSVQLRKLLLYSPAKHPFPCLPENLQPATSSKLNLPFLFVCLCVYFGQVGRILQQIATKAISVVSNMYSQSQPDYTRLCSLRSLASGLETLETIFYT